MTTRMFDDGERWGVQAPNNCILIKKYSLCIFDMDNKLVITGEFMRLLR